MIVSARVLAGCGLIMLVVFHVEYLTTLDEFWKRCIYAFQQRLNTEIADLMIYQGLRQQTSTPSCVRLVF